MTNVSFEAWKAAAVKTLRGQSYEEALLHEMGDGITIDPLYTHHTDSPPPPGMFPFTRSTSANPSEPITLARHEVDDLAAFTRGVQSDVRGGAPSIWIRSDADGPLQTAQQLREAFDGAFTRPSAAKPLIGWDAGPDSLAATALLAAALHDVPAQNRPRWIGFSDPLSTLAARGSAPRSFAALEAETVAQTRVAMVGHFGWQSAVPIVVSAAGFHNAGARPAQEIAIALSAGVHYLRMLADHGIPAATAARQIGFSMAVGRELFPEIAKLRALRAAWSRVLAVCGVNAGPAWLHATTSERTLSQRDPWVNLLRITQQTFAAIAGGADAITPATFDEACRPSRELGRRMARNTPEILLRECAIGSVVDPAGGSHWVETLTGDLGRAAWSLFQEWEQQGGILSALCFGHVQDVLDQARQEQQSDVDEGRTPITGVTAFADKNEKPLDGRVAPNGERAGETLGSDNNARPNEVGEPAVEGDGAASATARRSVPDLPPPAEWDADEPFATLVAAARNGASLSELSAALGGAALDVPSEEQVRPIRPVRDSEKHEAGWAAGGAA